MSSDEKMKTSKSGHQGQRYLTFSLGPEDYAIPLLIVKEVIAIPEVTPIPFTPSHLLGVMNLRGLVITIIDLRAKLGIQAVQGPDTSVIICDLAPLCLGFVADSINSVLAPSPEDVSERSDVQSQKNADYINGVFRAQDKIITLIDIAKALGIQDLQAFANKKKMAA